MLEDSEEIVILTAGQSKGRDENDDTDVKDNTDVKTNTEEPPRKKVRLSTPVSREEEYKRMKVPLLKELLIARDLRRCGKKAVLIERLLAYDRGKPPDTVVTKTKTKNTAQRKKGVKHGKKERALTLDEVHGVFDCLRNNGANISSQPADCLSVFDVAIASRGFEMPENFSYELVRVPTGCLDLLTKHVPRSRTCFLGRLKVLRTQRA
ncbi:MAG: hypothetical protein MHM6MM_004195 [Cercozoa sp. M6MM]